MTGERADAVVFDMDGVLIESESLWESTRRALAQECGGAWPAGAHEAMMGLNSAEWSTYMRDELGVPLPCEEIRERVASRLAAAYRDRLPEIDGAGATLRDISAELPVAIASSSPATLIRLVLGLLEADRHVRHVVSSDDVASGKPSPDVYLTACGRLGVPPSKAIAVEDSSAGIAAALAAGMRVVAIPNRVFPPRPALLERTIVIASLDALPALLRRLAPH